MKQPTIWGAGSSALLVAIGFHLAGFAMMPSSGVVQIAGGAPTQMAMLGNSFVDMVEGTMTPVATPETAKTVDDNEAVEPPSAEISQRLTPSKPTQMTPVVAENLINPVVPVLTATPDTLAPITPVAPLKTITSVAPPKPAPPKPAAKPVVKPRPVKPAAARARATTARAKPATPKPQGGAQSTRKGQSDGSTAGKTAASGQGAAKTRVAGNAAVSKYPGLVMRKISRTRKQRAGARGKATVAFKVSSSGAATSVRIIRSSGSAKIDQIALRHIQRASPFPRPPKGARRSFSVVFVSKG